MQGDSLTHVLTCTFMSLWLCQTPRLLKLLNDFILEMERGLSDEESSMKMIPSYVTNLSTGREAGPV
jgi:hexokinase